MCVTRKRHVHIYSLSLRSTSSGTEVEFAGHMLRGVGHICWPLRRTCRPHITLKVIFKANPCKISLETRPSCSFCDSCLPETRGFDFDGMMESLNGIASGVAILLHACAHNPTGVDPTEEQWRAIVDVCKRRKLIPILDNAYQGYASGDLEKDGLAMRMFESAGLEYFVKASVLYRPSESIPKCNSRQQKADDAVEHF